MISKDTIIKKAIKLYKEAEVPKGWKEFLKEKYEGGKKRVPNTNPDTKDKFPQVSMATLYKNDSQFKSKVQKEFQDWKQDKGGPKEEPTGYNQYKLSFHDFKYEKKIEAIKEKYKNEFDAIKVTPEDVDRGGLHLNRVLQGQIAEGLQKHLEELDLEYLHEKFSRSWMESSNTMTSLVLCDFFRKLGVAGSFAPHDESLRGYFKDVGFKKMLMEVYAFQQAFFRSKGIKNITLYRGVKQKIIKSTPRGSKVKVESRTISSFTGNALIAGSFARSSGGDVIKCDVPVERIFMSATIEDRFSLFPKNKAHSSQEEEYLVLGASEIECTKVEVGIVERDPDVYYLSKVEIIDKPES